MIEKFFNVIKNKKSKLKGITIIGEKRDKKSHFNLMKENDLKKRNLIKINKELNGMSKHEFNALVRLQGSLR